MTVYAAFVKSAMDYHGGTVTAQLLRYSPTPTAYILPANPKKIDGRKRREKLLLTRTVEKALRDAEARNMDRLANILADLAGGRS